MTQFTKSLRFDLANTFACNAELLADFFECALVAVFETEPQHEYFTLAFG